ncbi:hypothetical protein F5X96DRAFT_645368 [Biscogniauxia mediterranea]|nr:hypothetical protein F5X96DRAFT_645368 [Biscogniauxia mediterranea]
MNSESHQYTLWLWLEGMFPRRLNYFLLMKGLVSTPADLLQGKTNISNLQIIKMRPDMTSGSWKFDPETEPLPTGVSTPCLRVTDTRTGREHWIRESVSILSYFEDVFRDRGPALQSLNPLEVAATADMMGAINLAMSDGGTYLRHACPAMAAWSGLKDEDRSRAAALNAYEMMVRGLGKLQMWAQDTLAETGWLTPGISGPGLADITLAAGRRYLELGYGWDTFEREELKLLAEWYERFKKAVPWWDALEEREDVHPKEMMLGKESREV